MSDGIIAVISFIIVVAFFGSVMAVVESNQKKRENFEREIACLNGGRIFENGVCK